MARVGERAESGLDARTFGSARDAVLHRILMPSRSCRLQGQLMSLSSSQRLAVRRRMHGRRRVLVLLGLGTFVLASAPAFGPAVVPLALALALAWFLWRSDFESGRN